MDNKAAVSLCDNLQYEILSWLPPKSLIRYRSVSKSWYSIIHDPFFIKKHTENQSRNDDNRIILVIPRTRPFTTCRFYSGKSCEIQSTLDLPFTPNEFVSPKVSSCNGLLCLADYYDGGIRFHIWNPTIRFLKLLPPCDSFRPSFNNDSTFGIAFHSLSNDCRVVRLTYYYRDDVNRGRKVVTRTEAEVYSLSTDSWRMVKLDDGRVIREIRNGSESVNGYIYWLAKERRILSFNTNNDAFEETMHPYGSGFNLKMYHIAVLRGGLCVLIEPYFASTISTGIVQEHEIWMMREHGVYESWTKLWNIRHKILSWSYGLTVKGELVQYKGVNHDTLCVYDHENLRYYDLCKGRVVLGVSYKESLALLDTQRGSSMNKKRKFSNM